MPEYSCKVARIWAAYLLKLGFWDKAVFTTTNYQQRLKCGTWNPTWRKPNQQGGSMVQLSNQCVPKSWTSRSLWSRCCSRLFESSPGDFVMISEQSNITLNIFDRSVSWAPTRRQTAKQFTKNDTPLNMIIPLGTVNNFSLNKESPFHINGVCQTTCRLFSWGKNLFHFMVLNLS